MFETKYITNFGHSFSGSTKLENICYMDTRRGTDFHAMFLGTKLSVINWNIDLRCATDVGDMFNSVNMSDKGVTFINVPRNLSIATTQLNSSKYTIKNYIETALNPEDVSDDDPIELS